LDNADSAVRAGDYEICITEMQAALEIAPDSMSIPYTQLAFCYDKLGRKQQAWWAVRQAVLVNSLSSDNRSNFRVLWQRMKDQGLRVGLASDEVLRRLGTPDIQIVGSDLEYWMYGLVELRFENGTLVEIVE
jgi:hypothetical protein